MAKAVLNPGGERARPRACAAALAALLTLSAPALAAAPEWADQPESAHAGLSAVQGLSYELSAAPAPEGTEAMFLQARLATGGGLIELPIHWRLSRHTDTGGLELIAEGESAAFAAPAAAGDYEIEIGYGEGRFRQDIKLTPGEQATVTFILDMGGVRLLSKLDDMPLPYGSATMHEIYAASGPSQGRLALVSDMPGELVRLPAGQYRVESRIGPGNAVTETMVEVRAGQLATVEIGHRAGLVSFSNAANGMAWTVRDYAGRAIATVTGALTSLILAPGTYRVEHGLGAAARSTAFTVEPGQSLGVVLPE